ncbi:hypothetical protein C3747_36g321 [Trypanosoma cruzi]|uniref:C2H2-type domain-containing protein n=1 Tax=Trypanosoma cruzi TaxID=5693 RepID=A0A2V2X0J1_TRYCR|nr:hypothetical protein C3747_36g321 [Trypanosoma cruzi]
MESTIFTETLSTAACVSAPSRRTVEAREHTSTVLDHLVTHIVGVPFFLASSTEGRAHGCGLFLATAACPGNKLVMHKPRRRPTSHSSQTHGAPASSHWPDVLLVSDSSGQELTAPLQQATGNPTRTGSTVTRREETAPACPRTGVSHEYGWLLRPLQPAIPRTCRWRGADAAQQTRKEPRTEKPSPPAGPHTATIRCPTDCTVCGKHCSCRTSVVTHMANAHGITRSQALREFGFRGVSEPPEIPPEPPPST